MTDRKSLAEPEHPPPSYGATIDPETPEYRPNVEDTELNCCGGIIFLFVMIWNVIKNICPFYGQYLFFKRVCFTKNYLDDNDSFNVMINHIQLILNGWIVLYLIYMYCRFIDRNFNDNDNRCKKYFARLICGYIIIDIIVQIWNCIRKYPNFVCVCYELCYTNKQIGFNFRTDTYEYGFWARFFGYIFYTLSTIGVVIFAHIIEYCYVVYQTFVGNFPRNSSAYYYGCFWSSLFGGVYLFYDLLHRKNLCYRIIGNVALTCYNVGIGALIYIHAHYLSVLIVLCIFSFPTIRFLYVIANSYGVVKRYKNFKQSLSFTLFRVNCYMVESYHRMRVAANNVRNRFGHSYTNMRNNMSKQYANIINVQMRRATGHPPLAKGMDGYYEPNIFTYVASTIEPIPTYEQKLATRNTKISKTMAYCNYEMMLRCVRALVIRKFKNQYGNSISSVSRYYVDVYKYDQDMTKYKQLIDNIMSRYCPNIDASYSYNYDNYHEIICTIDNEIDLNNKNKLDNYIESFTTVNINNLDLPYVDGGQFNRSRVRREYWLTTNHDENIV